MNPRKIHIGTSGWNYPHWKGVFYSKNAKPDELLDFYRSRFDTVELNNSFYQLPDKQKIKRWIKQAGQDFIFSVKASRYITHMKKLKDPEEPLNNFLENIETFGSTLGPILFQLPPNFKCNPDRLNDFLAILPPTMRYTFEFRNPTWFCDDVYEKLRRKNLAFCIYELDDMISPKEITADFIYIRLHGPAGAYEGCYNNRTLSGWAGAISSWISKGLDVYCYFDNDQSGYAAKNAKTLIKMLSKE